MSGKIKLGGYKGGRGYCGYYINKDGKQLFLRSTGEFIFAKKLDYENKHFLTEKMIFKTTTKSYKPDFFIYDETYSKLVEIVEIKNTNKECQIYLKLYKKYFESIGIVYNVYTFNRNKKYKFVTHNEINDWILQYIDNYDFFNYTGLNNPNYGMLATDKTKKLIGEQTKLRFLNEDYKKKHSESIKRFWDSNEALPIKEKYRKLRTSERDIKNPLITKTCLFCNTEFISRTNQNKKTCSNSCSQKYNWKIGKMKPVKDHIKGYKQKIKNHFSKISDAVDEHTYNDIIVKYKKIKIIPLHFGMNLNVINKYFGTLNNLKKECKNG